MCLSQRPLATVTTALGSPTAMGGGGASYLGSPSGGVMNEGEIPPALSHLSAKGAGLTMLEP